MKKLSVAIAGALALSVAAVLVVRNRPNSNPQTGAAAPAKAAAQGAPVQPGGAAPPAAPTGDPDIFQKIVQRHDEQVRARGDPAADKARAAWDKMMADFDDSMREEPGVKKFGAARQVHSIGPGESVIMGGWSPNAGQRMVVFITPTVIDAAGNSDEPPFNVPSEIQIDSKLVSVPEQVLVKLGLQTLFTEQNKSAEAVKCSQSEFRSYINAIEQSQGADVLSAPRVTTLLGRQASVSVSENRMISGKNQTLGPALGFLATLSSDGVSVDLTAIAQFTEAATEVGQ